MGGRFSRLAKCVYAINTHAWMHAYVGPVLRTYNSVALQHAAMTLRLLIELKHCQGCGSKRLYVSFLQSNVLKHHHAVILLLRFYLVVFPSALWIPFQALFPMS